jgi:hypothetical protein
MKEIQCKETHTLHADAMGNELADGFFELPSAPAVISDNS